jgi:NADPH-dependent 2,4-dienoyl-CoA reductase/sulfur reductase-like enzyme/rhodanese-related sulfurtransferase
MPAKRIVVVGGTAAGPKAAARAKRLDQAAEVILLQKAPELSMASCGYPYYVSGGVADRDQLLCTPAGVVRDALFFAGAKGVKALVGTEALAVDRQAKTVTYRKSSGTDTQSINYDKLILCTGSTPRVPRFPGVDLEGVVTLHAMSDADALRAIAAAGAGKNVVVTGGGLIGMETCEALTARGMQVTVVEKLPHILAFLDPELSMLVENHVRAKGVRVITGVGVAGFEGTGGSVSAVRLEDGRALPCDLTVVALGVEPNVKLAREAGLAIGVTGGILVDAHMRTSDQDIYAAGDCVETYCRLSGRKTLAPYGDLANLEGRVAGENAILGDRAVFPGTIFSGICKIFDFTAGSTGLSWQRAKDAGYDAISVVNAGPDKPGFMGAKLLVSKMIADAGTGRILGFQCVGTGEVNRQVSEAAMAVMGGMTVEEACMADLPYAPPFSLAIDHFIATAHILDNKMRGLLKSVSCLDVQRDLETGLKPYFLDVRGPKEFEAMRLGIGEKLIPLGQLRSRLDELPVDKKTMIVTYCKVSMRGYEAQRILEAKGYKHVLVMEGGIMAWPF